MACLKKFAARHGLRPISGLGHAEHGMERAVPNTAHNSYYWDNGFFFGGIDREVEEVREKVKGLGLGIVGVGDVAEVGGDEVEEGREVGGVEVGEEGGEELEYAGGVGAVGEAMGEEEAEGGKEEGTQGREEGRVGSGAGEEGRVGSGAGEEWRGNQGERQGSRRRRRRVGRRMGNSRGG